MKTEFSCKSVLYFSVGNKCFCSVVNEGALKKENRYFNCGEIIETCQAV